MSRNEERRDKHNPLLAQNLQGGMRHIGYNSYNYKAQTPKEKDEQDFRTAKTAEIFTTTRQYYTLPDLFGMEEKINISGKTDKDNWTVRIPSDYEKFYYSQASKGYAMNMPKAYEIALCAKGIYDESLINALNKAAEILASDGPMTTKEADKLDMEGKLGETLDKIV